MDISQIIESADLLKKVALEQFGHNVQYDAKGAAWIDQYIDSATTAGVLTPSTHSSFVPALGAFLGECIRNQYGGEWQEDTQRAEFCIRLPNGICVFPFSKIWKRLENGMDDSAYALFASIAPVLDKLKTHDTPTNAIQKKRPWWQLW